LCLCVCACVCVCVCVSVRGVYFWSFRRRSSCCALQMLPSVCVCVCVRARVCVSVGLCVCVWACVCVFIQSDANTAAPVCAYARAREGQNACESERNSPQRRKATDSTKNATPPIPPKSRNSNSSIQIKIKPKSKFEFVPRDTEKSKFLDEVDFGGIASSVETVIVTRRERKNSRDGAQPWIPPSCTERYPSLVLSLTAVANVCVVFMAHLSMPALRVCAGARACYVCVCFICL